MMEPILFHALSQEAVRLGVVDAEILRCYPTITGDLKVEDGKVDAIAVSNAVKAIAARSPSLFRPKKPWDELSSEEFSQREASMRESNRGLEPASPSPFRALDASRLQENELQALSRCVGGQSNSFDTGLLRRALARQHSEDAALSGDVA
jgi:hypothetical protein